MKLNRACHCCGGTGQEMDPAKVGGALRTLRCQYGRSLRQMAERLKISAPYLSDLERGRRNWSDALIARFKQCL